MIFRAKRSKYPIKSWSNVMDGEVAFILGNGPSLLENDLNLLENYFTIGINRIFKVFSPVILFWQDEEILKTHKNEVDKCASIKVCRDKCDPLSLYTNFSLDHDPYLFHKTPGMLCGRGCSGAISVQMAVAMGCKSIVLLGCDGIYLKGKTDFYGRNKFHKSHTLSRFNSAMKWVKDECPIPVYNCGSNFYWPKISLKEAIKESKAVSKSKMEYMSILR